MALTVAIDAFRIVGEPLTSGAIYVAELVRALSELGEINKIYLLLPRRPNETFLYNDLIKLNKVEYLCPTKDVFPERGLHAQVFWIQWVIAGLIRTNLKTIDYYIAPYHHPPVCVRRRVQVITVVHDLCGLRADCGYVNTKKGFYKHLFLLLMASIRSNLIVPISRYTSEQLRVKFPFLVGRISTVVYNGINSRPVDDEVMLKVLENFGLRQNAYFLAFGSPGLRKGLDLTLGAYNVYRREGGQKSLALIVPSQDRGIVEKSIRSGEITSVTVLSGIDERDRDALYKGAAALIFPSRCEGFGYPILEAMRQSCPPIAWKNGPASEIVGDVLPLLETLEIVEIVQRLRDFTSMDRPARVELGERLFARSLLFTGDTFAREFVKVCKREAFESECLR